MEKRFVDFLMWQVDIEEIVCCSSRSQRQELDRNVLLENKIELGPLRQKCVDEIM